MSADLLHVVHERTLVGTLTRDPDGWMQFVYAERWLDRADCFPISISLPLRAQPYVDRIAHRFFQNLLPEGPIRIAVARRLGLSVDNDFALLRAIGGECAGALSIVDPDENHAPTAEYTPLTDDILTAFARGQGALASVTAEKQRLSLAGAQDKLPVLLDGDAIMLPVGNSPSSHILKFPNRDFSHLPENETLVTALARACELPAVQVEHRQLGSIPVAIVTRYDRVKRGGTLTRLHQEDLCQALGLPPSRKYEQEGGPSFAEVYRTVRSHSSNPLVDCRNLLDWLIFCLLVGNADGHAKNLSFLYHHGTVLAPWYDLVCTRAYRRLDRHLALTVGGESDPGQIRGRHWQIEAEQLDIGARLFRRRVQSLAEDIPVALTDIVSELEEQTGNPAVAQMVAPAIRKQCRRTLTLLEE